MLKKLKSGEQKRKVMVMMIQLYHQFYTTVQGRFVLLTSGRRDCNLSPTLDGQLVQLLPLIIGLLEKFYKWMKIRGNSFWKVGGQMPMLRGWKHCLEVRPRWD